MLSWEENKLGAKMRYDALLKKSTQRQNLLIYSKFVSAFMAEVYSHKRIFLELSVFVIILERWVTEQPHEGLKYNTYLILLITKESLKPTILSRQSH